MNAAAESLLDSSVWNARGFADGWQPLSATRDVTEPATGETLGTIGIANAADIDARRKRRRAAQPAWAALPYERRAEILRAAARSLDESTADVAGWLVRESGSVSAGRTSKSPSRLKRSMRRPHCARSPSARCSRVNPA